MHISGRDDQPAVLSGHKFSIVSGTREGRAPLQLGTITRLLKTLVRFLSTAWYYMRSISRKIREDDILFLASGLAFNGILAMIPLMLLSAWALGTFLNSSQQGVGQLNDILNTIFPPQPFAGSIREKILTVVSDIIAYRRSLGLFGAGVLVWTATSLFDALRSVLHKVYRLNRTRGLLVGLIHDVGFVFLVFLLFLVSNFTIWVYTGLERLVVYGPFLVSLDVERYVRMVPTGIVVVLAAVMFYIVYRYIPDIMPPRTAGIISTVTTTVLWVLSGKIFAFYLSHVSALGKLYGPYAFLLVLLFWIYYSSLVFVLGAIVGQVYWERRKLGVAGGSASVSADKAL